MEKWATSRLHPAPGDSQQFYPLVHAKMRACKLNHFDKRRVSVRLPLCLLPLTSLFASYVCFHSFAHHPLRHCGSQLCGLQMRTSHREPRIRTFAERKRSLESIRLQSLSTARQTLNERVDPEHLFMINWPNGTTTPLRSDQSRNTSLLILLRIDSATFNFHWLWASISELNWVKRPSRADYFEFRTVCVKNLPHEPVLLAFSKFSIFLLNKQVKALL